MSNISMAHNSFRLKRTVVDGSVEREAEPHDDAALPPIQLDHARMDRALAGPRHALPDDVTSPSDIVSFLNHLAKEV